MEEVSATIIVWGSSKLVSSVDATEDAAGKGNSSARIAGRSLS